MPKKKAILFVEYQRRQDTIRAAKESGYKAILLTQTEHPKKLDKIFDEVIMLDLSQREKMDEIAAYLQKKYVIKGILSNYEHFVVQRSYLAECFAIPSSSVYSACCTRNKVMQREALKLLEENIEFAMVSDLEESQQAFQDFDKDMYLKSIAGVKSCFVEHIKSQEHLQETWEAFQKMNFSLDERLFNDFSFLNFDFPYPDPKKHMLAEKAYSGQQIAVASLAAHDHIWHAPSPTDVYTAKDIGRDDSFLAFRILPSKLNSEMIKKAHHCVEKVSQVLGLQLCGIHAELIVTPENEIKIIEVASRIGGYRAYMYEKVYGLNLCKMLIKSVINSPVKNRRNKASQYVSMMEIFPENEGKFMKVQSLKQLENDPQLERLILKVKKGDMVGPAKRAYSPVLTFSLLGESYEEVFEKSLFYQKTLRVELMKPSNV